MKYILQKDKIRVTDIVNFCPKHILECGQVFRYKLTGDTYTVFSTNKCAKIVPFYCENNNIAGYDIITKDTAYFASYFDLDQDYNYIKKQVANLSGNKQFMLDAIEFGRGIRILNQNEFEATISFIISQNNNIKRIQLIIERICEKFGTNMGEYFAFPTIEQFKQATEQDFKDLGAGYRAKFLINAIKYFDGFDYISFKQKPVLQMEKELLSITGIGQKVADCIMLFGYHKMEYFPVDTWIEKVYKEYFSVGNLLVASKQINRLKIREFLTNIFGLYSGYAQQYLFYYQRAQKNLKK